MKRITAIFVIGSLIISLSSCGVSSPTATTSTTTTAATTTEITPAATTTTTTEASAATPENTTYSDDDSVPKEWLSVYTTAEALADFDEIVSSDSSDDISAELLSLVHKNVIFFATMRGKTFEIDWDNPSEGESAEADLYPIKSEYFSDLKSIENLSYDTYSADIAKELLYGTEENPRVLFTEKNDGLYVDPNCISNWTVDPFFMGCYMEITDITDESVSFKVHYPDYEGLNEPDECNYFYYDNSYTAIYDNGELRLTELLINN